MTSLANAKIIADKLTEHLAPHCERLAVAGAIRRERHYIPAIQLVAIDDGYLWEFLDGALLRGTITKTSYRDKGIASFRWNTFERGFTWAKMPVEIFRATADTWGFKLWAHTGPDEANRVVFGSLNALHAPFRFRDGYCVITPDMRPLTELDKLPIPDEETLFQMLGIEFVPPTKRVEMHYRNLLYAESHQWGVQASEGH